jgi:hypothetical protein
MAPMRVYRRYIFSPDINITVLREVDSLLVKYSSFNKIK